MKDIEKPVTFDTTLKQLIKTHLNDPSFSHSNWGDSDLLPVRTHIRNHYGPLQKYKCYYCREKLSRRSTCNRQVEHIVCKSEYEKFMFEPKNMILICSDCNEIKGSTKVTKKEKIKNYPQVMLSL
ncbi:hypothetical protein PTB57_005023 [Vibrio parahaemolyticus]|nr:hypothetical protein [Vibrio parahaemolyticus]EKL9962861.1 hypothetical protein [Vibrio parahaemolyticus]